MNAISRLAPVALLISASVAAAQPANPLTIPETIDSPAPLASPSDNDPDQSLGDESQLLTRELKPVLQLRVDIRKPPGKLPEDFARVRMEEHPMPASAVLARGWPTMAYSWKAPGSRHFPLYFEEVNAERYGYTCSRCLQPAISAAHFFGTIPALPYLMAADCPRECVYTLGHYRPGNCNPWRRHCWPCRLDAAVVEAGTIVGLIALIP